MLSKTLTAHSFAVFAVISLILLVLFASSSSQAYQGFGALTQGGFGKPVYHVTNLNDSGSGSFRDAVSQGNRYVVFDIGGTINLATYLYVQGSFITIDGFSAPAPGITIKNYGLIIRGIKGAHDVIVQGIRVRDAAIDGFQVAYGAYNIVLDHVSSAGSLDENIEITEGSHDVTVSWSIFAAPGPDHPMNMLIKYNPSRISLHHNAFVKANQRNPQVRIDDVGTAATDTTIDMRNNLVWDWGPGYGTLVWYGPKANIINNFYQSPSSSAGDKQEGVVVDKPTASAYVSENFSGDGATYTSLYNSQGNVGAPFAAPAVDTTDACTAANQVLAGAGVRPLDAIDQSNLSLINLASCGTATNTAPVVNAGIDKTITLQVNSVALDGTVTDDGLPNPPGSVATIWSKQSGPGTVLFGNSAAVDTTAAFSEAGAYILLLTANDGALSAADTATVTVQSAPGSLPTAVSVSAYYPADKLEMNRPKIKATASGSGKYNWKFTWDGGVYVKTANGASSPYYWQIAAPGLAEGNHTIAVDATDVNTGAAGSDSLTVAIGPRPITATVVGSTYVKTINGELYVPDGYSHKFNFKVASGHYSGAKYGYTAVWGDGTANYSNPGTTSYSIFVAHSYKPAGTSYALALTIRNVYTGKTSVVLKTVRVVSYAAWSAL